MVWFLIFLGIFFLLFLWNWFKQKKILKIFSSGNVIVSGLRGRGKDLLFCFVINKRKRNYISNVQYSKPTAKYQRFDFDPKVWELASNTHVDLVEKSVKPYTYPYPDNIDYYISDSAVYFPAAYFSDLQKRYKSAPLFQALSRHLGDCNVHCNTQVMTALWDKMRLQSDLFIVMRSARVFFHRFSRVSLYLYNKRESAEEQIIPPRFGIGKTSRQARYNFEIAHGKILKISFWFVLKYAYDSRRFKKILENRCVDYEC